MKINLLSLLALLLMPGFLSAQKNKDKDTAVNAEIRAALLTWNQTTESRDTAAFMNLFNRSGKMLLTGSDSSEIYRGEAAIHHWISLLFKYNSFSWAMNEVDIDHHGNTAWVFVNGEMVANRSSGKVWRTPYRFTGVLVKKKEGWKWRLFNGSIPRGE